MRQSILDKILKDDDLYEIFSNEARKEGYICPITHETFNDPVIAGDGYTYERRAIENWLMRSNSSPMTRETISHTHLIKNIDMKNRVLSFLEEFHKKHIATNCTPAEVSSAAAFTSGNFGLFSSNGMQADGRRETETSASAVNSTAESVTGVTASASAGSENMRQRYSELRFS